MRKKLVLSVMGILLILGTVANVMFTRAEKSSDRTWLASIEALEALAEAGRRLFPSAETLL